MKDNLIAAFMGVMFIVSTVLVVTDEGRPQQPRTMEVLVGTGCPGSPDGVRVSSAEEDGAWSLDCREIERHEVEVIR